jgi:hypothetical protein
MRAVQNKVANDVFMILIKQARDQAIKMNTGRPEALGESHLGKIGIIGEEFNMDFMVSAPDNFIEEAKQEIIRLNEEAKQYKLEIKELNKWLEKRRLT